jgi:phytoene synthase
MEAVGWRPPRQRVRVSKPALLWTVLWLSLKR